MISQWFLRYIEAFKDTLQGHSCPAPSLSAFISNPGGYQMLGARLEDPAGAEGPTGDGTWSEGLGLLPVTTSLMPDGQKVLRVVQGAQGGPSQCPDASANGRPPTP
eukprot:EG_transcript_31866